MKIKRLKLNNFRQFKEKEIVFEDNMTAFVGPNARGKSTIIEAIYMLSTGLSPWTSDNSAIVRNTENANERIGRIEADIEVDEREKNIALVIKANNGSVIKEYRVNDKSTTRPKFVQNLNTVIFSPDLIDLLMFEPRQRRVFLDSYVSKIDIEYADTLQKYEKAVRQRNKLLKILSKKRSVTESDKNNLKAWTTQILDYGSLITLKRIQFIERINEVKPKLYPNKIAYKPNLEISEFESLGETDYIRNTFKEQLTKSFRKELAIGVTMVGPHRDDWTLEYKGRNLNRFGSRGEKRMAITDLAFKMNNLLIDEFKDEPIILLDDISSELDAKNTARLFTGKIENYQQTILTTTDLSEMKKSIKSPVQIIEL